MGGIRGYDDLAAAAARDVERTRGHAGTRRLTTCIAGRARYASSTAQLEDPSRTWWWSRWAAAASQRITTYLAERTTNTAVLGVEPAGALP